MQPNSQHENEYISRRIPVTTEFEEVFSHFYVAKNHTGEDIEKTLLPSFQTILIFSFGTPVSFTSTLNSNIEIDKCLLLGPVKQPLEYILSDGANILIAHFKGDAFYRFFSNILSENLPLHPDDLMNQNCFTNLWHLLNEHKSSLEKVNYILNFCRPYLKAHPALKMINHRRSESNQANSIKVAIRDRGKSENSLQHVKQKFFSYSEKEISRYQRFLKAVELLENLAANRKKIHWYDIIQECEYFDETQLILDFKHYLNLSPTKFLRFQQEICIAKQA